MKNKLLHMTLLLGIFFNFTFAGENLLKVKIVQRYDNYFKVYINRLSIISLTDSILIKTVKVNKGNCPTQKPNKVIKYGQKVELDYFCDDILKIDIETDKGMLVFDN